MEIVAAGEDGKREFCTAFWLRGAVWAGWSVRTKDHCPTPTPVTPAHLFAHLDTKPVTEKKGWS